MIIYELLSSLIHVFIHSFIYLFIDLVTAQAHLHIWNVSTSPNRRLLETLDTNEIQRRRLKQYAELLKGKVESFHKPIQLMEDNVAESCNAS